MFKSIHHDLLSFDLEWIPDPRSAHILHNVDIDAPGGTEAAYQALWQAGGATEERPQPYIKTILCRIVSVAGIFRESSGAEVDLQLFALPADPTDAPTCTESHLLDKLLKALGRRKPQLVGYNSANADVPIIVQRAIANGLSSHGFAERPDKPWEGVDYFSTASEFHIDMGPMLGRYGQMPTLHEAATLSGIPGKIDTSGASVPQLWAEGRLADIVAYNECDAFTTHLLWARFAHFAGLLSDAAYKQEQALVRELLEEEIAKGKPHLERFVAEWDRLQQLIQGR